MLVLTAIASAVGSAQTRPVGGGVIEGLITTQGGTIRLGGAQIVVRDAADRLVASMLSEGDGHYRLVALPGGRYLVTASLGGFETMTASAVVTPGATTDLSLDLPIAAISQTVTVVGTTSVVSGAGTLAPTGSVEAKEAEQYSPGGGVQGALRLLASVIEVPGGISIKGGRPNQASVQLGAATLVDPATGLTDVSLPDDAIDSVSVLPNPYAVEYGRFSSGLVVIQTRRAADVWKTRLNNLDPTFRTKRGQPFSVKGIQSFAPRFETGGPIIKDRLFIEQTAKFRYAAGDVPSRPEDELRTIKWFSSFTRLDVNTSPRHSLIATGGLFPSVTRQATLGTFTPPEASVDIRARVNHLAVTERSLWTDTLFSETTIQVRQFQTDVLPRGSAPMELQPDTTIGNFFNRQHRNTATFQMVEAVAGSRTGFGGLHLFKAGVDLLYSNYDGSSASNSVLIERADGTLARRLDYVGPRRQLVNSTDLAFFAQDRIQPHARWYVEFGGRLDRDGVIRRFNVTPRVGTAVLLNESGTAVVRSGFGFFYERTPSAAGAFKQYENFVETRYAADGATPIGRPMPFQHTVAPELHTSRSLTWDLAYDQRFNARWAVHVGSVDRHGSHELLVEPVVGAAMSELRLDSNGRSTYREVEFGVHFTRGTALDLNASYVRSLARADLNAFTTFFDSVLWPVVGVNQYAPARADAPHRLLVRGRAMPTVSWLLVAVVDWRTGLPYSVVDEALDFVGSRNERRFPNRLRLELGVERRIRLLKFRPWVGVRADNAFDAFLPTDVQANIASPAFGSFYNSEYRQFRIQVRFER